MGHKFYTINDDGFYISKNWDFIGLTDAFESKSGGAIYDTILYIEQNLPVDPGVKHPNRYCNSPLRRYRNGHATSTDINIILGTFYNILRHVKTIVRRNPPDYVYKLE